MPIVINRSIGISNFLSQDPESKLRACTSLAVGSTVIAYCSNRGAGMSASALTSAATGPDW